MARAKANVSCRNDAAVHALSIATVTVCGPAKRSRSRTCATPELSVTATATWKPSFRHAASVGAYAQDAENGADIFKKCRACHQIGENAKNADLIAYLKMFDADGKQSK